MRGDTFAGFCFFHSSTPFIVFARICGLAQGIVNDAVHSGNEERTEFFKFVFGRIFGDVKGEVACFIIVTTINGVRSVIRCRDKFLCRLDKFCGATHKQLSTFIRDSHTCTFKGIIGESDNRIKLNRETVFIHSRLKFFFLLEIGLGGLVQVRNVSICFLVILDLLDLIAIVIHDILLAIHIHAGISGLAIAIDRFSLHRVKFNRDIVGGVVAVGNGCHTNRFNDRRGSLNLVHKLSDSTRTTRYGFGERKATRLVLVNVERFTDAVTKSSLNPIREVSPKFSLCIFSEIHFRNS